MKLVWDEHAWEDHLWWQAQDRKVLRRINALIADVARHGGEGPGSIAASASEQGADRAREPAIRHGDEGIGKPEALRHGFQGYWSRRITDEHRLIDKIVGDEIRIAACRYHYAR